MNLDEIFEKFPEVVFGSFRQQMLLGVIPAETVGSVLEPLLANFWDVMPRLSLEMQADFENILRVYPDVAARFGIRIKPPIEKSLPLLAEYLHESERLAPGDDAGAAIMDLAAEEQKELDASEPRVLFEGQGFFKTDKDNSVYLEFSFAEGDDFITFGRRPVEMAVDIRIRGRLALMFRHGEPEKKIGVGIFREVYGVGEFARKDIEIVERRESGPHGG